VSPPRAAMKNGVAPMTFSAVTPTFGRRVTLALTSAPCALSVRARA
jgi:hypothetical protein